MPTTSIDLTTRAFNVPAQLGGIRQIILRMPAVTLSCTATQSEDRHTAEFSAPTPALASDTLRNVRPFNRKAIPNRLLPNDARADTLDVQRYLLSISRLRISFEIDISRGFFPQQCGGRVGPGGRPLARARYIATATAKLLYTYKVEKVIVKRTGGRWVPVPGDPVLHEQGEFTFFPNDGGRDLTLTELESPCQEPALGATYSRMFPYRNLTTVVQISEPPQQ